MNYLPFRQMSNIPACEARRRRTQLLTDNAARVTALLAIALDASDEYLAACTREALPGSDASQHKRAILRNQAAVATRRYAEALVRLANDVREMVAVAAQFWGVSEDVARSGLDASELGTLCEVLGRNVLAGKLV